LREVKQSFRPAEYGPAESELEQPEAAEQQHDGGDCECLIDPILALAGRGGGIYGRMHLNGCGLGRRMHHGLPFYRIQRAGPP
jgi:hypothetical protein